MWEGKGVVASARKMIGATKPLESEPGTIRGDFAIEVGRNVIHGSDSPENGERETGACCCCCCVFVCDEYSHTLLFLLCCSPLVRRRGSRDLGANDEALATGRGKSLNLLL